MLTRSILTGLAMLLIALVVSCSNSENKIPPPCSTCPEYDPAYQAADAYIEANRELIGLRPGMDELLPYSKSEDSYGSTHIRYYQYYRGVHVIGGEIIVHLDEDLHVTGYNGELIEGIDLNQRPQHWDSSPLEVAERHFDSLGYAKEGLDNNGLCIYRWQAVDYLAWHYTLRDDTHGVAIEYFVDDATLEIVHWQSTIIVGIR